MTTLAVQHGHALDAREADTDTLVVPSDALEVQSIPVQSLLTSGDASLSLEKSLPNRLAMVVGMGVAIAVGLLAIFDRARLDAGTDTLLGIDREWMTVAAVGVLLIWIAGAATQLGAMSHRPPLGRLFAVQIAGSFANHLLPAGTGGLAINMRFLRKQGLSRQTALAAQAINHAAGVISHLVLFAAALVIAPRVLSDAHPGHHLAPRLGLGHALIISVAVGVACLVIAGGLYLWRRSHITSTERVRRFRFLNGLRSELPSVAEVLRDPACGIQLWLGSFVTPLLHAGMLVAVVRGLAIPLPAITVVVVYIVASTLSGLIPSPGGLGALDVTLTAGLVAGGASAGLAFGAVMAYRLITVWVPLIPGALVLGVLVRRRII